MNDLSISVFGGKIDVRPKSGENTTDLSRLPNSNGVGGNFYGVAMTDETEDTAPNFEFEQSAPEFVTCHNHVIVFPWGSDMLCSHLKGLALRIDAATASIEVFDDTEHYWKPAEKNRGNVASLPTSKKP